LLPVQNRTIADGRGCHPTRDTTLVVKHVVGFSGGVDEQAELVIWSSQDPPVSLTVSKQFGFSASHTLSGLPDGHKCSRLHGHSYRVRVDITGERDAVGFVIDYGELDWVRDLIETSLDHRHLNEAVDFNPTAENIAEWLCFRVDEWIDGRPEADRISSIGVAVSETQATWATSTLERRR
jgi:6-pyruvoyltetrahydropterin/6-carboxytetrahydropterin synthase